MKIVWELILFRLQLILPMAKKSKKINNAIAKAKKRIFLKWYIIAITKKVIILAIILCQKTSYNLESFYVKNC